MASPDRESVVLRCVGVDGSPRYDLPASYVARMEGYEVFWRPTPAEVFHHTRRELQTLEHAEFVLVGVDKRHCVSLGVDEAGALFEGYVNINLPPKQVDDGWTWQDLKLDIKLALNHEGEWSALLLDLDEFDREPLSVALKAVATREVDHVLEEVAAGRFPFSPHADPWLGVRRSRLFPE